MAGETVMQSLAFLESFGLDMMLLGGVLLVTTALMIRLRNRRREQLPNLSAAEQIERNRQARGMRGDLEQVMVEVEQLARRFGAQLDAKSIQLNKLIEQADERIARLEALEQTKGQMPSSQMVMPPAQAPQPPGVLRDNSEDELTQSIYRLADAGNDAVEIARTLREHVGKIELILALRNA